MRRWIIQGLLLAVALATAAVAGEAAAQSTVLQSGAITPRHGAMWKSNGVISDAGPASGGAAGAGLGEFLQVNPPTPPGTGPDNTHSCFRSGPLTGPFNYLCLDANALGATLIEVGAVGGATALPLVFKLNGASYNFPTASPGPGNILGPNTTTIGNAMIWNNNTGTLAADAGRPPVLGPATTTSGEFALWNNTTGSLLKDGAGINITHTGNLLVTGTVTGTGASSLGNTTITGTLSTAGNTTIGGTLGVTGITTLNSDLNVFGTTILNGATTATTIGTTGTVAVGGDLAVAGTMTVTGNGSVSGLFTATTFATVGAASVGSTLAVSSTLTASGNVTLSGVPTTPTGKQPLCIDTVTRVVYAGTGGGC